MHQLGWLKAFARYLSRPLRSQRQRRILVFAYAAILGAVTYEWNSVSEEVNDCQFEKLESQIFKLEADSWNRESQILETIRDVQIAEIRSEEIERISKEIVTYRAQAERHADNSVSIQSEIDTICNEMEEESWSILVIFIVVGGILTMLTADTVEPLPTASKMKRKSALRKRLSKK